VSVAGNVAHAVLTAPSGRLGLAAAAAVVPPAVLLGATHSVALLVRTRRVGFSYWCALAMTVALAGCAFVLSFDALRELATALGMPRDRAWLWPVAIDVSIANSTVSLLSLAPPPARRNSVIRQDPSPPTALVGLRSPRPGRRPVATGRTGAGSAHAAATAAPRSPPAAHENTGAGASATTALCGETPALRQWRPAADELVRCGVTSKDPAIVAAVLADHAAGTAPSTISRRHKVQAGLHVVNVGCSKGVVGAGVDHRRTTSQGGDDARGVSGAAARSKRRVEQLHQAVLHQLADLVQQRDRVPLATPPRTAQTWTPCKPRSTAQIARDWRRRLPMPQRAIH
jgi:hypothetical protein